MEDDSHKLWGKKRTILAKPTLHHDTRVRLVLRKSVTARDPMVGILKVYFILSTSLPAQNGVTGAVDHVT
jgi:hypothetical protein